MMFGCLAMGKQPQGAEQGAVGLTGLPRWTPRQPKAGLVHSMPAQASIHAAKCYCVCVRACVCMPLCVCVCVCMGCRKALLHHLPRKQGTQGPEA